MVARRAWEKGKTDSLWSFKGLVKVQQWQSFFALLEVVAFLVGLACLTYVGSVTGMPRAQFRAQSAPIGRCGARRRTLSS